MNGVIGQTLCNRYLVDAFLGRGGMADVYRAWDQSRAVFLAIKILHADLAEDKIFLRRFRREAETLSRLQHPYIVRCYGIEQDEDQFFIVMEYVEGTTLRKEIARADGPLSDARILEIMRPVCSALHFAHSQGMAHCDIKPANIMIEKGGKVLLADFGIARMTESATTTMVGVGTPAYMAPEQARGDDPCPQTDIYSLGIVLYEMLTGGERPFTGEQAGITGGTGEKLRWEHRKVAPPSPRVYNPSLSREMEAVVLRCLEKEPAQRYASALDLLNGLEKACHSHHPSIPMEGEKSTQSIERQIIKKQDNPSIESQRSPLRSGEEPNRIIPAAQVTRRRFSTLSLLFPGIVLMGILAIIFAMSFGGVFRRDFSAAVVDQTETPTPSRTPMPTRKTTIVPSFTLIPPRETTIVPSFTLIPPQVITIAPSFTPTSTREATVTDTVPQIIHITTVAPDPDPRFYNFYACSEPCAGDPSKGTRLFPEGSQYIYVNYDYENIPENAHYERIWSVKDRAEWVRYDCTWQEGSNGHESDLRLWDQEGLTSGEWMLTIEINDQVVLQESIMVEGNYDLWTPAGLFTSCYGRR